MTKSHEWNYSFHFVIFISEFVCSQCTSQTNGRCLERRSTSWESSARDRSEWCMKASLKTSWRVSRRREWLWKPSTSLRVCARGSSSSTRLLSWKRLAAIMWWVWMSFRTITIKTGTTLSKLSMCLTRSACSVWYLRGNHRWLSWNWWRTEIWKATYVAWDLIVK